MLRNAEKLETCRFHVAKIKELNATNGNIFSDQTFESTIEYFEILQRFSIGLL